MPSSRAEVPLGGEAAGGGVGGALAGVALSGGGVAIPAAVPSALEAGEGAGDRVERAVGGRGLFRRLARGGARGKAGRGKGGQCDQRG
ncbi:hypothetical protein MBENS4_4580 [Novosphingobium sp. MBES04]|nr:hypothetical protein MBENS4_4580 [Novosphingobium sp. MBES04]